MRYFSDFFKTNMEERQLVSITGKEFQIVGPQKRIMNCLILALQK